MVYKGGVKVGIQNAWMTEILKASSLNDTGLEQAQADELQSRCMAVDQSVASLCFLSIENKSLLVINTCTLTFAL